MENLEFTLATEDNGKTWDVFVNEEGEVSHYVRLACPLDFAERIVHALNARPIEQRYCLAADDEVFCAN